MSRCFEFWIVRNSKIPIFECNMMDGCVSQCKQSSACVLLVGVVERFKSLLIWTFAFIKFRLDYSHKKTRNILIACFNRINQVANVYRHTHAHAYNRADIDMNWWWFVKFPGSKWFFFSFSTIINSLTANMRSSLTRTHTPHASICLHFNIIYIYILYLLAACFDVSKWFSGC